jgi:hypothetical protein
VYLKHDELNVSSFLILLQITADINQVVLLFAILLLEYLLGMELFIPRKKTSAPQRARFCTERRTELSQIQNT